MWLRVLIAIMAWMLVATASGDPGVESDHKTFSQNHLKRLLRTKIETIEEIASNEMIIRAVRKQNQMALSPAKIREIDAEWIRTSEHAPFKRSLQESEVGRHFKSMIDFNESIYSEAFLTDRRGANIAAYPTTTDYWQGDEKKWIAAFNDGSGETYVGPIAFDESTQTTAIQISTPVMDEGKAIGVLIVGIKLTYVQAKFLRLEKSSAP